MLKGDLTSTPLAPLLLDLATEAATGCLTITDSMGDDATVYLKSGSIYAVSVPGSRPQLGAKLVSSGSLAPDALADALNAQRTELQGWRLGELLVHLGYVEQPVVEAFVKEQVCEAMWDLLRWPHGEWKFRKSIKTREDVGPPVSVRELLETLRDRGYQWESISAVIHGPGAVPTLSARSHPNPRTTLDSDAWSMLCKIDGERTVTELAHDCGYTMFEAGHIILSLVRSGLVDIAEELDSDDDIDDGERPYGASTLSLALTGQLDDAGDAMTKLARLADDMTGEPTTNGNGTHPESGRNGSRRIPVAPFGRSEDSFAASIAKVSNALSEVLGDDAPTATPADSHPEPAASHVVHRPAVAIDDAEMQRRKRARAAAAEEMATAQALIESLRDSGVQSPSPEHNGDGQQIATAAPEEIHVADPPAAEDARQTEDAARVAAEQFARAAAEEADRLAAERETQRRAAEQAAAEEAERAAAEQEALRIAAAAAERERQEAEQREAARVRAEREAAEVAAWEEHQQREAAERAAAEEAARLAAEAEAAAEAERVRAEAERVRAEAEQVRVEAEQVRAEREAAEDAERARLEAERIAAEQAEQVRVEAQRIAVEEAQRQAAEVAEAARLEEERQAEAKAEQDAARHADEAAAAKALLIELASETETPAPEAEEIDEPDVPTSVDETTGADDDAGESSDAEASARWAGSDNTDTAALLRELSSLGGDEERTTPQNPQHHRAPRPGSDKKPKKKIGLFGL